jgi:hypothetical protein
MTDVAEQCTFLDLGQTRLEGASRLPELATWTVEGWAYQIPASEARQADS